MVKSRDYVEQKMKDRVSSAGKYLRDAMDEAPDPIEILLTDPEGFAKKLQDGLAEAIRRGNYKVGLQRAKERDAWKNAKERAGSHYEERADDMVARAMETYDKRAECIEKAKNAIKDMPKATRQQRIARSQKYLQEVADCFDKVFGRKS